MRLKISDWPPVASHGALFILGYFAAGLALQSHSTNLQVDKDHIMFTVPQDRFIGRSHQKIDTSKGLSILVRESQGKHRCFRLLGDARLVALDPNPLIGVKKTHRTLWRSLGHFNLEKDIFVTTSQEGKKMNLCQNRKRVRYGS